MQHRIVLSLFLFSRILAASDIILPSGLRVSPSQQITFTVTLAQAAPYGGVFVMLSNSDPSKVSLSAAAVLINQGSVTSRPVRVTGLAPGTATIGATASDLIGDTQTITVADADSTGVITLPPAMTLAPNQSAVFAVAISPPAPAGGVTLTLASSDSAKVSLSSTTAFIAAGASAPSVQPRVNGLAAGTSAISVSAPGYLPASQTVGVVGGSSGSALSFAPATVSLGIGQTNTIQLNSSAPAPGGGIPVSLTSSNTSAVTVPPSVTIGANSTTASVPITGVGPGSATITATANSPGVTGTSASVSVNSTRDFSLPTGVTVGPGQQANFPVTLAQPAPYGGVFLSLSSSDPSKLTISPANALIAQGQTTLVRPPQITGIAAGSATVSATAYGMVGDSQTVLIGTGQQLLPGSLTITGVGATQSLTLSIATSAPPGGVTFNLSSSNPGVATVPQSVTVPGGSLGAVVPVTSVAPGSTVITSRALPTYPDATANVFVAGAGAISLPAGLNLSLGQSVSFPITLTTPAPSGGVGVTLANSDPGKVLLSSASVFIAGGATTPAAQPQITGLASGQSLITASASGYSAGSQVVQVQSAQSGGALSFSPNSLTLPGITAGSLQLNLSTPAPAGGLVINIASSSPGVVSVPATVTMGANSTAATIVLNGVAPGSATITASTATANITGASATVIVNGGGSQSMLLPIGLVMAKGDQASFPITLAQPAPAGGVFVALSSSDPSKVTINPASVFVQAGSTTLLRAPQLTALAAGSSTISASAYGLTTASAVVQVGGAVGFEPVGLTIYGVGVTQTLTLSIPILAPPGGFTVTLRADNAGIASLPATMVVPAGTNSVQVPITSVSIGTTAIYADAPNLHSMAYVSVESYSVSVEWHGGCWYTGTINGNTGRFHAVDFQLTTSTPVPVQGSLFFNDKCELNGYDNMNDFNTLTGSGHIVRGFVNNWDVVPTSALYWVGPRTLDGSCPKGVPCSGCIVYTKTSPPECNTLP